MRLPNLILFYFILPILIIRFVLAEPLEDEDLDLKEDYIKQGFPEWSRRDFQQLIRGMETYGWCVFNPFFRFFRGRSETRHEGMPTRKRWPARFRTRLPMMSRSI